MISNCPDIYELSSLQYRDRFCQDERHKDELDELCVLLTDMCINAAKLTLPRARDNTGIPGWNDKIRPLKDTADFWSEIWGQNDRPDIGLIADIFLKTRRDYHYAVRAQKWQV